MSNGGTFTMLVTPVPGGVISASNWIAEFMNIINNLDPAGLGSGMTNTPEMQATSDPYPGGTPSVPGSLKTLLQQHQYVALKILQSMNPSIDTWGKTNNLPAILDPVKYHRDIKWSNKSSSTAAGRRTLVTPNEMVVVINGAPYRLTSQLELDLDETSGGVSGDGFWDQTGTDYRVAATRAGKDFYAYAVVPASGSVPDIILSANSTVPAGYTASTSRKIGGCHCLCVDVGTIASHDLTDYLQGDILPASVWDLKHRVRNKFNNNDGHVYDAGTGKWVFIYLASGTGVNTASVYGATITDMRDQDDFSADGAAIGMRLLYSHEFSSIAEGSNQETNISTSADPVATGGHSDTAGRRMISYIGCEDCCGAMNQWLLTPAARFNDGTAGGWYNLPSGKGSFYTYGNNSLGNSVLVAGGNWSSAANSGSLSRKAYNARFGAVTDVSGRFAAESL